MCKSQLDVKSLFGVAAHLAEVDAPDANIDDLVSGFGDRGDTWRTTTAARIDVVTRTTTEPARAVRSDQDLDLSVARLRVSVRGGGVTVLDEDRATWTGAGGRRDLDAAQLSRHARLGLFSLLHRLATGDLAVTATEDALRFTVSGESLQLVLDDEGRPSALRTDAGDEALYEYSGWRAEGVHQVPGTVTSLATGHVLELRTFRVLRRFNPTWVR